MKKENLNILGGFVVGAFVGFYFHKSFVKKSNLPTGKSEVIGGAVKKDATRGACFDAATNTFVECSTVTKKTERKNWLFG
jgi:hypothetical protein